MLDPVQGIVVIGGDLVVRVGNGFAVAVGVVAVFDGFAEAVGDADEAVEFIVGLVVTLVPVAPLSRSPLVPVDWPWAKK